MKNSITENRYTLKIAGLSMAILISIAMWTVILIAGKFFWSLLN
ncbi:MAG TPA: hypothetical protein PK859_13125 [Spirochaetota bacterium]|nr:hypothetical protein [Spirochaetota bacterium]HPR49784.1 hypothetical protein [Spirochaetota bacterium]